MKSRELPLPSPPQVDRHPSVCVDCSTGATGLLVTKLLRMRSHKQTQSVLKAKFDVPVSRGRPP